MRGGRREPGFLAYLALRIRGKSHRQPIERLADGTFLAALCLMVIVCGLVAYELV
jgi:hypothetical protein